ncbi:MAG: hypothetical protein NC314_10610 [Roseburia sp.]|nr:hypothetical protein [Roseburia sp.]MCM1243283.1 hypothetical protein [Roseburia sp.]
MKRRTKKLVFPLLMSGIMIGSNVCYVCAQGQIADVAVTAEAPVAVSEPESSVTVPEAQPAATAQAEQTVQPTATDTQTEQQAAQPAATDTQTEQVAQPAATDTQTEQTTQPESETQTEGTTETNGDVQNEADVVTPEQGIDVETGEGTENDTESTDVTGEVLPDDAAAADGAEELPEQTFVNASGEEVLPSTLVGVDYNTVSELYDGAANVVKQYMISEAYAKDTVMACFVDENGNLVMTISLGASAADTSTGMEERDSSLLESILGDGTTQAPAINGTFSGWDNIPVSYEYNWDNSANCWQWGNWVDDPETGEQTCYKTEEGTYNQDVRHKMQLYCDGENVYLRITYATIYGSHANGEDFNFYFDREPDDKNCAKFQITYPESGDVLTNSVPGANIYKVDVRNGDTSNSWSIVDGAEAYYLVTDNNINNQLELKIPLEALKTQLREKGIEVSDNFSVLEYTTPNLMYRRIATAGSPTGAEPFAAAMFLLVPTSYIVIKKKDKKEMAFA